MSMNSLRLTVNNRGTMFQFDSDVLSEFEEVMADDKHEQFPQAMKKVLVGLPILACHPHFPFRWGVRRESRGTAGGKVAWEKICSQCRVLWEKCSRMLLNPLYRPRQIVTRVTRHSFLTLGKVLLHSQSALDLGDVADGCVRTWSG